MEQNPVSAFTPAATAQVPKGRCRQTKKDTFLSDIDSAFSKDSSQSDSEEELRLSRQASQHRRHSPKYLGRKKGPRYPELKEMRPTNPVYVDALLYRTYRLEDVSNHRGIRGTGKVRDYINRIELRLSGHNFSGEDPIMVAELGSIHYLHKSCYASIVKPTAWALTMPAD